MQIGLYHLILYNVVQLAGNLQTQTRHLLYIGNCQQILLTFGYLTFDVPCHITQSTNIMLPTSAVTSSNVKLPLYNNLKLDHLSHSRLQYTSSLRMTNQCFKRLSLPLFISQFNVNLLLQFFMHKNI